MLCSLILNNAMCESKRAVVKVGDCVHMSQHERASIFYGTTAVLHWWPLIKVSTPV